MALVSLLLSFSLFLAEVHGTAVPHVRRGLQRRRDVAFHSYTALGDSYASGDGPFTTLNGTNDVSCRRTKASYPYQLNLEYGNPASSFQFLACGGANTTEITTQVSGNSSFGSPDFVTLDAGGNDGRFVSNSLTYCIEAAARLNATAYEAVCNDWLVRASALQQTLKPGISALIAAARTKNLPQGRTRKVVVTAYAQPFNISGLPSNCPRTIPVPPLGPGKLADRINLSVLALNAVIAAAAYENGALYADIDAAFDGHRICDEGGNYFQTDPTVPDAALAHPTVEGYQAMAEAVARSVGFEGALAEYGNNTVQSRK